MMRVVVLFLLQAQGASAFTTRVNQHHHHHQQQQQQRCSPGVQRVLLANNKAFDFKRANSVLFAGEQDISDDDASGGSDSKSQSFDDAGRSILDQEDQKLMEEMGNFDSNPDYNNDNIEKMRAAVRERVNALGVEKSVASQKYIEEAKKRAQANIANNRPGALDLSQISSGNEPKSKKQEWDEELPAMLYDPTDDMTEEQRKEADPIGQLSTIEQLIEELKLAKWPTVGAAFRELAVMFTSIALTAVLILAWDRTLRNTYTTAGFLPTKEEIPGQVDSLDLPSGFTNGMSEEDLAKMTEEMNTDSAGGKSSSRSGSPSIDSLKGSLEDL